MALRQLHENVVKERRYLAGLLQDTAQEKELQMGRMVCKPVPISYTAPDGTGDYISNEMVHFDTLNATWEDDSLMLVPASAMQLMRTTLEQEKKWTKESISSIDHCRHDYLREHAYLMDEIGSMVARLREACGRLNSGEDSRGLSPNERLLAELRDFQERAIAVSEAAAVDIERIVSLDDAAHLAQSAGPRGPEDDEYLYYMRKVGITTDDELSIRVMLKRMREACEALLKERRRLEAILATLRAGASATSAENLVESIHGQAISEGSDLKAIVDELLFSCNVNNRAAVETAITNNLRERYDILLRREEQAMEDTRLWREKLARMEENAARIFNLQEDAAKAESKVHDAEMALDAKRRQAEEDRKRRRLLAASMGPAGLITDDDIREALSDRQRAEYQEWENTISGAKNREASVLQQIQNLENQAFGGAESIDGLEQGIQEAEERILTVETETGEYEHLLATRKTEIAEAKLELKAANRDFAKAEEIFAAKNKPPLPNGDLRKLEILHAEKTRDEEYAARKLENLYLEEARLKAEVDELTVDIGTATPRRAGREEKAEVAPVRARAFEVDPAFLPYHERIHHPQFKDLPRDQQLSVDSVCQDKRMVRRRRAEAEAEADSLLSKLQKGMQPLRQTEFQPPINFRRPEDLKVRLVGREKAVGHIQSAINAIERNAGEDGVDGLNEEDRQLRADLVRAHEREDLTRNLLAAEIVAPAAVKRALWNMRTLLRDDDDNSGDAIAPAVAESSDERARALAELLTARSIS